MLVNAVPRVPAYPVRLGAIELIELGSARRAVDAARRPFLSSRYPRESSGPVLGQMDFLASVGSFMTGAFEYLFKTLADLISVPLDLASKGIGILFDGLAGFLRNIPIVGVLAAELLLVGKAVIQFALSVPGLLLNGIGNIFGEVKDAIDATKSAEDKKNDEKAAENKLLEQAKNKGGEPLMNAVKDALGGKPPSNTTPPPKPPQPLPPGADTVGTNIGGGGGWIDTGLGAGVDNVLQVGLPIAGAAALLFVAIG
jgi:hypothetical protein